MVLGAYELNESTTFIISVRMFDHRRHHHINRPVSFNSPHKYNTRRRSLTLTLI